MELRLKSLREEFGLSQQKVSEILYISQVTYSYYEIGKRGIPLEILSKLADYYNVSLDYLTCRTNERKPYPRSKKV